MNTTTRMSKHLLLESIPCLTLCVSVLFFAGCGRGGKGDIKTAVKTELEREFLAGRPVEITSVSVNWKRTTSLGDAVKYNKVEGSGTFSATAKTTEGFYEPVSTDYGLRKLGITDSHENELNEAKKQIEEVSRRYEADLRHDFPYERLDFPSFFEVRISKDEKVTLTGTIELVKHGKEDWKVEEIKDVSSSIDENAFTRETKLRSGSCKLDDPKEKDTVNAIVQKRRDFTGNVNSKLPEIEEKLREKAKGLAKAEAEKAAASAEEAANLAQEATDKFPLAPTEVAKITEAATIAKKAADAAADAAEALDIGKATEEAAKAAKALMTTQEAYGVAQKKHEGQAELEEQKTMFQKFCKPSVTYEGHYQYGGDYSPIHGMVYVVFGEYVDTTKTAVRGTVTFSLLDVKIERPFTVAVETREITAYPVTGIIDNSRVPMDRGNDLFFNTYGLKNVTGNSKFKDLIQKEINIAIRFADTKVGFFIGDSPTKAIIPLNVAEPLRPQPLGIGGTWRQYIDGRQCGDFHVSFNANTGLYEMSTVKQNTGITVKGIYDVRYDGQTWSFNSDWGTQIGRFVLKQVNVNAFEGIVAGRDKNRWERISSPPPLPPCTTCNKPIGECTCQGLKPPLGQIQCTTCKGHGNIVCPPPCKGGNIETQRKVTCNPCNGTGKNDCKPCNGSGHIVIERWDPCGTCRGTGTIANVGGGGGGRIWGGIVRVPIPCPTCLGKKGKTVEVKTLCTTCNRTGKKTCTECRGDGEKTVTEKMPCRTCDGKAKITCAACKGTGRR